MSSRAPSSSASSPTVPILTRPSALVPRVANVTASQDIVQLKARAKCVEGRADDLETAVRTLQERSEKSQEKILELTFRLDVAEAQYGQLHAQLSRSAVLKSVGLEIGGSPAVTVPAANMIAPVPAGLVPGGPFAGVESVKVESLSAATDSTSDI
jgi:hypothetical protein